jgi:hypothetical protein
MYLECDLGRVADGAVVVHLVRVRVGELGLAVGLHSLATEHDLGGDIDLALQVGVQGGDGRREARGEVDARHVVDAEVARSRALHEARASVGIGGVVFGL